MLRVTASRTFANASRRSYAVQTGGAPKSEPVVDQTHPKTNPAPGPSGAPGGGNGPLIIGALALAAGGAYWYTRPEEVQDAKSHAQSSIDEAKRSAQALQRDAEKKAADARDQSRAVVDQKTADLQNATQRAKDQAVAKYDQVKASAAQTYDNAKQATQAKAEDAKQAALDAEAKTKSTASSWWWWGSSKKNEAVSQTAQKVEEGADKVKAEAQKKQ
ncbi:hypothetical protein FRB93_007653 [Tulasnella sp. JGI-2019a]|nr:hypothetical protein FRB93_007653 [Tulasnella sp. JGI-2019a]